MPGIDVKIGTPSLPSRSKLSLFLTHTGWVVFGCDQNILKRDLELQAFPKAKVHVFLFPATRPATTSSSRCG